MVKMRDKWLEQKIQNTINSGSNVWVIGDVHGFYRTYTSLLGKLKLVNNDIVILLGDLIDRGPESSRVIEHVKSSSSIFTVRGNHESMMSNASSS